MAVCFGERNFAPNVDAGRVYDDPVLICIVHISPIRGPRRSCYYNSVSVAQKRSPGDIVTA
jgi:hypothetical protein